MSNSADKLPKRGDVIASKYLVEGLLGEGGMGAVFEVSHRVTGKRFAVKWLLPQLTSEADAVKRFIREAQVAGRVDHPNIVEVYDVGQDGDSCFMVMELLQGESLAACLARESKLSVSQACRVMIPVISGLAAAHAAGVVHRDLKPDNIFLCNSPTGVRVPKLLDFGISKMSNLAGEVTSSITRSGVVMGTPHYMAPEQVRAKSVDERTDVYALGVILYEMLSGVLPFPGDTYSDLVLKIMTETPRPLAALAPETPPALAAVVSRAMARDPAERFANVTELARALQPFADGMTVDPTQRRSSPSPLPPAAARTQTPLSTSSERVRTGDFEAPPRTRTVRLVGLVALATALVGGGIALVNVLAGTSAEPSSASPPSAAAMPRSTPPVAPPTNAAAVDPKDDDELPAPNTVRIGPAPEAVRAGSAPQAVEPSAAAEPSPEPAAAPQPSAEAVTEGAAPSEKQPRSPARRKVAAPRAGTAPAREPARTTHRAPGLSLEDF